MFKTTGVHNQNHLVLVVDPCCFEVCSKQQGSTTKIILFWLWTPVVLKYVQNNRGPHPKSSCFGCGPLLFWSMFKTTGVHNQNHLVLVVDPCCFEVCSKQQGSTTKIILFWLWTPVVLKYVQNNRGPHPKSSCFGCGPLLFWSMFKTTGVHNQNHIVLVMDPCCFEVCSKQQGSTPKIILFWLWTPVVLKYVQNNRGPHPKSSCFGCGPLLF